MRIFLTASMLAVVVLGATNPTTDEYVSWAVQEAQTGQKGASDLLIRFVGAPLIKASTTSSNFTFFSMFVTSVDRNTKFVTIGALHRFVAFPMQDPWKPGSPYATSPHVIALNQFDRWAPEDGYTWVANPPNGNFQVKWTPGISSKSWPHVVAGATEGRWYPEDGYSWVEMPPVPGNFRVKWTSGLASRQHEHVVAAPQEQRWLPEQGFAWIEHPPKAGDFRVRRLAPSDASGLPRLKGKTLRQCDGENHFSPDSPCWFSSDNGIYVASKLGNRRSSTFAQWPDVDDEITALPIETTPRNGCETISSRPSDVRNGVTLFEGHAVCSASTCSPNERVGAQWNCPERGGTPIGRWEYTFGPQGTRWRKIGEATWHPLPTSQPSSNTFSKEQIEAQCSAEADARGLHVKMGFADARWAFRRECLGKMGIVPPTLKDFRVTPQSKAWDPDHATPQEFEAHARAMEASLPSCSKEFEDRWSHWHSEGWYSRQMPKTAACIMHGETGSYKCDGSECCRIGSAC